MMVTVQATDPQALASWPEVMAVFLAPAVGLVAVYRFRTGWGDQGATLRDRGAWGAFLARFGYVLLPFTIGMFAMALGLVSARLLYDTKADVFGFLSVALWIAGVLAMVWGIKEYRRPSRWRHRPAWLVDFERDQRRR